jgi:type II secretory pathway predicted ATPase ExeA
MKDLLSRFGFHCTPFTREIGIADRFPLQVLDDALKGLTETIDQRMSCALVAPAGTYPSLVRKLQENFSDTSDTLGLRPVLILDEAHDLRVEVLAMLRILTNFDMDSRLVLSIVLVGQPKLRDVLRRDELDDVAKRISHFSTLRPLSRDETQAYVEHRCGIAGAATVPFDKGSLDAIFEIGRGNLRATDQLARKALGIAHDSGADTCCAAYVAQAKKVLWP